MKKYKILIISFCFLVASLTWIQADTNQNKDVFKQIEELHKKIERLEKQIKNLEVQFQKYAESRVEIPLTFPKLQKIPKDWKEFEYNGLKYYIIPLNCDSEKTKLKKK